METEPIIRRATEEDAEACAGVIYQAFCGIADRHHFPRDFPDEQTVRQFSGMLTGHPRIFGVVAEVGGRIVGCNFLDERDAVKGVGPMTVEPRYQSHGIGRRLMRAVIERGQGAASVRLVQDAFNVVSMSLYTSLGFDVKEPLALLKGKAAGELPPGAVGRPMTEDDLNACAQLCRRAHRFDRINELRDALPRCAPHVLLREGRLVAYCSAPGFWPLNHGVAETADDLKRLLCSASSATGELALLLPIRQGDLFRWCLSGGLRVIKLMTLMSMGQYMDPNVTWFPSVAY